jgi:TonB family protein
MDGSKSTAWKFVAASVGFHSMIGGLFLCVLLKPWPAHPPVVVVQVTLVDPIDNRPGKVRSMRSLKTWPRSSAPSPGQAVPVKTIVSLPPDAAKVDHASSIPEPPNEPSAQNPPEKVQPTSSHSPKGEDPQARNDQPMEDGLRSVELSRFLQDVRDRLEQAKQYPWLARIQGQEGTVRVQFMIDSTGEAREIRLLESSRSKILDQEAVETVKRVGRFSQFPVSWNKSIQVQVPLVFQLNPP